MIVTDPTQFPRSGRLIAGLLLGIIFDEYSLVRISQNKTDPSSLAEAIVLSLQSYIFVSKMYILQINNIINYYSLSMEWIKSL